MTDAPIIYGPDGRSLNTLHVKSVEPSSMYGSFQGAMHSIDRGFVYFPTLDSQREVDSYSRTELTRKSRFIYNSGGGLIHRGINGFARMICGTGLMPYPLTRDRELGRKIRTLYAQRCGSRNTFDLARRYTCGQAQRAIVRSKIKDGDMASVLARDEDSGRLRCAFYESTQIGNGVTKPTTPGDGWVDGVKLDKHDAAVKYRILGRDRATNKEIAVDVPAEHVLFVHEQERFGQIRGLPRLYPVINKVLDRGEIMAALTKGVKVASQIAYVLEQQMQQGQEPTPGRGASIRPTKVIETHDGKQIELEQFLYGGEAAALKPGQSFKIVQSTNPHQNVREHLNDLVRDIAWAIGVDPGILWNIIDLGGANMRFVQADLQSQIEQEQEDLVDMFLGPHYIAWIRDMIEAGEIEEHDEWDQHGWLAPGRLTVDFGRDGKLHIEQYKRGLITMKSLYGFSGFEWQAEIDQYLDERLYIKEGVEARNMTWEEAFPEVRQQAIGQAAEDLPERDDDADDKRSKN